MKIRDQQDGTLMVEAPAEKLLTFTMIDTAVLTWKHDDPTDRYQVDKLVTALTLWLWKGSIK